MGFSDVLATIERWEAEPELTDEGREELKRARAALEGKQDPLSTMARSQVERLLGGL